MSRSETLRVVETELSRARDMVKHPDDEVLRYLIDIAISEARDLTDLVISEERTELRSPVKRRDQKREFPNNIQYLAGKKAS